MSEKQWQVLSLEVDYPGKILGEYFEENFDGYFLRTGKNTRNSWVRHPKHSVINLIDEHIPDTPTRKIIIYGSGGLHHYTYGLCVRVSRSCPNFGYIHFDHHDDYNYEKPRKYARQVACGTFVKAILEDTNASAALSIGNRPPTDDMLPDVPHPYVLEKHLRTGSGFNKLKRKLKKLPKDVYISIDLDVMHEVVIKTGWSGDQGTLTISELIRAIKMIKKHKNIIGADIVGSIDLKIEKNKDFSAVEAVFPGKISYPSSNSPSLYLKIVKAILE